MPIDMETLGDYNPEVEEIKRKAYTLAEQHTRDFHCGSGVLEALRSAGIERPRALMVEVRFKVPGDDESEYTTEVDDFDLSTFKGKTTEEQLEMAAQHLSPSLVVGDSDVDIPIKLEILDLNVVKPAVSLLGSRYRLIKPHEGRVAHIYVTGSRFSNSCCGQGPYLNPGNYRVDAEKGTGICKKCQVFARVHLAVPDLKEV